MNNEPLWLAAARDDIGLRELPGAPTAPKIAQWLKELGAWWRDDETPWCGTAVAAWMKVSDIARPKYWYRAKGWLEWGTPLGGPVVGAVVVFERAGGGHVGLVVGKDPAGRLLVLGGNQGDSVRISAFDPHRVVGYRWPTERVKSVPVGQLPTYSGGTAMSTDEL